MSVDIHDDTELVARRLRLGLPLLGYDGRVIPLRYPSGEAVSPIEAAVLLMLSGAALLAPKDAAEYAQDVLARAQAIECESISNGESAIEVAARTTAAMRDAAERARFMALDDREAALTSADDPGLSVRDRSAVQWTVVAPHG